MAWEYRHRRQVEFVETDMAGIVHFSYYFRYMEQAEHAFYRSLGISVETLIGERNYGWPRLEAHCRFLGPLRLDDEVETHLLVREKREKILVYDFTIRKMNADPPEKVATGQITVICVLRTDHGMKSAPIPEEISNKIEAAPAEYLNERKEEYE